MRGNGNRESTSIIANPYKLHYSVTTCFLNSSDNMAINRQFRNWAEYCIFNTLKFTKLLLIVLIKFPTDILTDSKLMNSQNILIIINANHLMDVYHKQNSNIQLGYYPGHQKLHLTTSIITRLNIKLQLFSCGTFVNSELQEMHEIYFYGLTGTLCTFVIIHHKKLTYSVKREKI